MCHIRLQDKQTGHLGNNSNNGSQGWDSKYSFCPKQESGCTFYPGLRPTSSIYAYGGSESVFEDPLPRSNNGFNEPPQALMAKIQPAFQRLIAQIVRDRVEVSFIDSESTNHLFNDREVFLE